MLDFSGTMPSMFIFTAFFVSMFLPLNILFSQIVTTHGGNSSRKCTFSLCDKFIEMDSELTKMRRIKENIQFFLTEMDNSMQNIENQMAELRDNVTKIEKDNERILYELNGCPPEFGRTPAAQAQNPMNKCIALQKKATKLGRRNGSSSRNTQQSEEENYGDNLTESTVIVSEQEYEDEEDEHSVELEAPRLGRLDSIKEEEEFVIVNPAENSWDPNNFHEELKVMEPKKLKVINKGKKDASRSVFAKSPIPLKNSGIFYYEVDILKLTGPLFIGIAKREMSVKEWVGYCPGTFAYGSGGNFLGPSSYGGRCNVPLEKKVPTFGTNDTVGCGVNLRNNQIIFTLNGLLLDTDNLFIDDISNLYPCVTLLKPGDKIRGKFGPDFKYQFH